MFVSPIWAHWNTAQGQLDVSRPNVRFGKFVSERIVGNSYTG